MLLRVKRGDGALLGRVAAVFLVILFFLLWFKQSPSSPSIPAAPAAVLLAAQPRIERIHLPERLVLANAYSGTLKKPVELGENDMVVCPERGGKNTQCSKVGVEYEFRISETDDYFLYVEVIGPDLNANSLWVGVDEEFLGFETCDEDKDAGELIPHKHKSTNGKWLCCPAYLGKNKKKGLTAFYSDCCFDGLGKKGDEKGCVLDLEVDTQPRWNQLPRVIHVEVDDTKIGRIVTVRLYAREDGTAWTRLALSRKSDFGNKNVKSLQPSTAR